MSDPDPLAGAAQEWIKKGTDAMGRHNWDFAVECFSSSIKMKPDVPLYRQTKIGCCRKKYGDNGTGAKMAGMKLMGIRGRIKKARMQKDWKSIDALVEDGLSVNPWDAQLFADLGQSSAELDRSDIAKFGYFEAVKLDGKNADYLRGLGYVLYGRNEFKDARTCFKRIYDIDSTDGDARSMMSKCDADGTIHSANYDTAKSTQEVKVDKEPTNAYEADRRARKGQPKDSVAPGESAEMDMRAAIRKDPENISLHLKLADLLRGERKLTQAMEMLDKAVELSKNNTDIREQREDVELEIMREKLAEASDRARKNSDKERVVEKAKALTAELTKREIEVFAARINNNINDMKMRFELAERYRKTKQYKLAIPLFQQASGDSRLKETALVALGECFVRAGQMDLGRRQFDKALETLSPKDNAEAFKNANYFLGRLYEKAKKNEQAEHHYTEILSVDYEYRDVLKRLQDIQGGDEFEDMDDV